MTPCLQEAPLEMHLALDAEHPPCLAACEVAALARLAMEQDLRAVNRSRQERLVGPVWPVDRQTLVQDSREQFVEGRR